MSIWMTRRPRGGTCQKCVVMPPVLVPTKTTRSASPTTRLAEALEYVPTTPTDRGCVSAMVSLPLRDVATGMLSSSARRTSAGEAPEARTPPPATMTGRSAPWMRVMAFVNSASDAPGRKGGTRANNGSHSTSISASA
jgi:hypothetical protein